MSEQQLSAKDLRAAAIAVRRVAKLEGDSNPLAALAHRLESVADEPGLEDSDITIRAWDWVADDESSCDARSAFGLTCNLPEGHDGGHYNDRLGTLFSGNATDY